MNPKYPDIKVTLVGEAGNAFAILGKVSRALRRGGVPQDEVNKYTGEAMSGDYDKLLQVTMAWVSVS